MQRTKPKEMIFDFLNTVFLLLLIAFLVFYFIVGNHWGTAEKIVKIALNLSVFSIFFLAKLKIVRHQIKYENKNKDFDDIAFYLSQADKIKSLISILIIPFLMILISFFWSSDFKLALIQTLIIFLFLYAWHLYLFRKRDSLAVRMYATILDVLLDSVIMYFVPVLILGISLFLDYYNILDIVNSLLALLVLYLRHRILFLLNEKK